MTEGTNALNVQTNLLDGLPVDLSPGQRRLALFRVKWAIGALRPLVQLKVPDLLADGPCTVAELAAATDSDVGTLYRALRCASASGVFVQRPDGYFASTPVSSASHFLTTFKLTPLAEHYSIGRWRRSITRGASASLTTVKTRG